MSCLPLYKLYIDFYLKTKVCVTQFLGKTLKDDNYLQNYHFTNKKMAMFIDTVSISTACTFDMLDFFVKFDNFVVVVLSNVFDLKLL